MLKGDTFKKVKFCRSYLDSSTSFGRELIYVRSFVRIDSIEPFIRISDKSLEFLFMGVPSFHYGNDLTICYRSVNVRLSKLVNSTNIERYECNIVLNDISHSKIFCIKHSTQKECLCNILDILDKISLSDV